MLAPSIRLAGRSLVLTLAALATDPAVPAGAGDSPLDSMVATERAFAAHSVEHGMRSAFLEYLGADGILFRPGPMNGIGLWKPRAGSPAVLDWAPAFAEISGAGDLGFSTGPWTFAAKRDTTPVAFGHFVTVWKREPDGPFKIALDIGINHPDPGTPLRSVKLETGPAHAPPESVKTRGWDAGVGLTRGRTSVGIGTGGIGIGVGSGGFGAGIATGGSRHSPDAIWRRNRHETHRLLSADRTFAFEARRNGWSRAYAKVAARDIRVYRDGHEPEIGTEAAVARNTGTPTSRDWKILGQGVSASWDLGYAYGLAVAKAAERGAAPDTSAYLHLWRKDDAGEWRMMLDLESPFPKR